MTNAIERLWNNRVFALEETFILVNLISFKNVITKTPIPGNIHT